MRSPLVVGFDLDMTLIDSRPGIKATYDEVVARTGAPIDTDVVVSRLGPPITHELAHWVPDEQVAALADLYRSLYPSTAIASVDVLPGAHEALAAVRAHGGRTVVVTAKNAPNARMHLDHLGLDVDELHGDLWRHAKGTALSAAGASAYVGDHVHDVDAARAADAISVAVATGPCDGLELQAAGADVVLHSLLDLPGWLDETLA